MQQSYYIQNNTNDTLDWSEVKDSFPTEVNNIKSGWYTVNISSTDIKNTKKMMVHI